MSSVSRTIDLRKRIMATYKEYYLAELLDRQK